jgi:tetratricopeptide (TPR) repeat protein
MAFFRAASAEVEGSNDYRELLAGLVVLRLLDKWRSLNRDIESRGRDFEPVERAVAALDDGPMRDALHQLVVSIAEFVEGSADARFAMLVDYAWLLEHDARWDVAADVYLTAIEIGSKRQGLLPEYYGRASVCFRHLGQLDRAEAMLRHGLRVAAEIGDLFWSLLLRLCEGNLARHKGDLVEAGRVHEVVMAEADAKGLTFVSAQARHDRGHVAYYQKQFGLAADHFHTAMRLYADTELKMRALSDLALVIADMGHLDVARTAFSAVRHSDRMDVESRNIAALNLMWIATMARDRAQFETIRRELVDQRLTGRLLAHYHIIAGEGALAFDDPSAAQREFAEAVVEARANRAGVTLREAERLLAMPMAPASMPTILADIRSHIGDNLGLG